jgi:HSP20 family protein
MKDDFFDIEFSRVPILQIGDDFEEKILSPLSYIREHESKWVLEFDLPMVEKRDINIYLDSDGAIVVEAKLKEKYSESKFSQNYEYEYFKKSISLPKNVDTKNISARFSNGILTITIPKLFQGTPINVE